MAVPAAGSRTAVLAFALAQLGEPYRWGAAGPNSWDCSGLVTVAYAQIGVRLPRTTGGLIGAGRPVGFGSLQPGDLVFTERGGHVGLYLGGGRMVHAPKPGDRVKESGIYGFYTARRV